MELWPPIERDVTAVSVVLARLGAAKDRCAAGTGEAGGAAATTAIASRAATSACRSLGRSSDGSCRAAASTGCATSIASL